MDNSEASRLPQLDDATIVTLLLSLELPAPFKIETLHVAAQYHSIYVLHFDQQHASSIEGRQEQDGTVQLILRVAGRSLPGYKTRNEVGCMTWIRNATTIPVPAVVRWSDSDNNPAGHEFTILAKARGVSVDKIYVTLDTSQKKHLVEQLIDYLVQLHNRPWPASVGGLVMRPDGKVVLGPPVDETFWQEPDIDRYWPGETIESLNALNHGHHLSFTAHMTASCRKYCHAIRTHASLEPFRDMIPSIEQFLRRVNSADFYDTLNKTSYIMAHKDLHFANIMCDPDSLRITAILDWEFSGVVPACRWDPSRAFLWNGSSDAAANVEKYRLREVFEAICREKGYDRILEAVRPNLEQEMMIGAVNFLRAITEVCPRGQQAEFVDSWKQEALKAMSFFDFDKLEGQNQNS